VKLVLRKHEGSRRRSEDRVGWVGPNHPAFLEILFASAKLWAVLSPVNHRMDHSVIGRALMDAAPRLVFLDESMASLPLPSLVRSRVIVGSGSVGGRLPLPAGPRTIGKRQVVVELVDVQRRIRSVLLGQGHPFHHCLPACPRSRRRRRSFLNPDCVAGFTNRLSRNERRNRARRGRTTQRGLRWEHQQMREQVLREETTCWICGGEGTPENPLTADHVLRGRTAGRTSGRTTVPLTRPIRLDLLTVSSG
jgi:hypothetical protein